MYDAYQAELKHEAMAMFGLTWEEVDRRYSEWAQIRACLMIVRKYEHLGARLDHCACVVCRSAGFAEAV